MQQNKPTIKTESRDEVQRKIQPYLPRQLALFLGTDDSESCLNFGSVFNSASALIWITNLVGMVAGSCRQSAF